MPCKPKLALMKAMPTKERALDQAGTVGGDAGLCGFPKSDGGGHGGEGGEEAGGDEPDAFGRADFVAQTADGGAGDEGEEGAEGLLVYFVEGEVAVGGGAFKEAGEGEGELGVGVRVVRSLGGVYLGEIAGLETTPDEDGGEGEDVSEGTMSDGHGQINWTDMKPVMKQNAASGAVAYAG
jgi:hypothetical protein